MTWIHKLAGTVDHRTDSRGRSYFHSGAVHLDFGSADRIEATVKGTTIYTVEIDVDDDAIVAMCTCPYAQGGNVCKHTWATLLAAEQAGHLKKIGQLAHATIDVAWDNGDFADDWDEPYTPKSGPRTSPQKPVPPSWQEHLSALRSRIVPPIDRPADAPRTILYVIDPAACALSRSLVVRIAVRRLKRNGDWGRPSMQENWIRDVHLLDAADRKILALLAGSRSTPGDYSIGASTRHHLTAASQDVLLSMMCATGRCFLKNPTGVDGLVRLDWDAGEPWSFQVKVQRDDHAASYVITAELRREGERTSLADPVLLAPGLVVFSNCVARFDAGGAWDWVDFLRKSGDLTVPVPSGADLVAEMAKFPALPPIELPEELRIEPRSFAGPPHLKIRAAERRWGGAAPNLHCELSFDYGGIQVPATNSALSIHDPSSDRFFARDREAEHAALAMLAAVRVRRANAWDQHQWELAPAHLPAAVHSLTAEGWRIEADGKLYRRAGSLTVEVKSGIDWFDLEGQAVFEGSTVRMPELLKAIGRGEKMVRLDDGSYGLLPEEWLKRYKFAADLGRHVEGTVRFARHQAGLLDALLASEPVATFDATFLRVRQELASFSEVRMADAPPSFNGQLREYQREGLGWLHFIRRFGFGGCLADDMGLGKTVQVLALLDSDARRGPALVVVPRSLVFNWKQEAARFAPRLRVLDHTGSGRKNRWNEIREHDIILTTYGTLRRDAALLKDIHFDTVILDEAQIIKNASTEAAKAARLLKADHRLALTGTPVENRISDLWSLFEFLNPGMLGGASMFRTYMSPKEDGSGAAAAPEFQILSQALRPFILRRTKEQVARELPPKMELTIYCELDATERRLYDELRDHYRQSLLGRVAQVGIEKSRMHILEALLRLRQAACHPGLIDKSRVGDGSAKFDALLPQIAEVIEEGHKVLVFSQFTSLLAILKKELDSESISYEYLDGRTRDRESRVRRFQEDDACRLFLISLKAGGLGLNLTAAEYVFLLDPWWNPAVEAQAIDRSHRIGQTRQVFAYRLIARDTVEEKVVQLQQTKRQLADAIITADNSIISGLTRENLELLLS